MGRVFAFIPKVKISNLTDGVSSDNMLQLHFIYQILHLKHCKNINFENSYLIKILFK